MEPSNRERTTAGVSDAVLLRLACAFVLMAVSAAAMAVERVGIEIGTGNDVGIVGAELSSSEWMRGTLGGGWSWQLYGKAGVALWRAREDDTRYKHLADFSAYPVVRLERYTAGPWSPYVEAGLGVHLLSRTRINDREFSTAFQFGEFAGIGVTTGAKREFDLGIRVQHVSNADIEKPELRPDLRHNRIAIPVRRPVDGNIAMAELCISGAGARSKAAAQRRKLDRQAVDRMAAISLAINR